MGNIRAVLKRVFQKIAQVTCDSVSSGGGGSAYTYSRTMRLDSIRIATFISVPKKTIKQMLIN